MERNNLILGSTMATCLVIGAIVGMLVLVGQTPLIEETQLEQKQGWHDIYLGSAAAGTSGVTVAQIQSHATNPATKYAVNLTAANNSYAWKGNFNDSMETNDSDGVPFDTNFDILVQYQFEDAHAYNVTNTSWTSAFVRAYVNSTDLSIDSTRMMKAEISKSAYGAPADGHLWVAFWLQDADGGAGSGFSIGAGQTINISEIKIQAYF